MSNARLYWQHVEVIGRNGKLTIPAKAGIFAYLGIFSARECGRQYGCMELATGPDVNGITLLVGAKDRTARPRWA